MKFIQSMLCSSILVAGMALSANAAPIVPGGFEAIEGNSGNTIPFGFSSRYQQFYAASAFSGPIEISSIAFRLDSIILGDRTFSYTDLSISLSTAATDIGSPSLTFANNIGSDVVNVFSGVFNQTITGDGLPVQDFDLVFNFSTNFNYNPANGALLLDVFQNILPNSLNSLDAVDGTAVGTLSQASPFTRVSTLGSGANSPTADFQNLGFGLVTQFNTVAVVPLPAALPLFGTGLAVMGFFGWRRKRQSA